MALEALYKKTKSLGLEVWWARTKVQVFGGLLQYSLFMHVARTLIF